MICSTTAAPTVTVSTVPNRVRASSGVKPPTTISGSPASSPLTVRAPNTSPTDSAAEPAPHEGEDLRRRPVEPLLVVDNAQERPVRSRLGEQVQDGQPDQEPVGHGPTPREAELVDRATLCGAGMELMCSINGQHNW